jgi:hypothetical protein
MANSTIQDLLGCKKEIEQTAIALNGVELRDQFLDRHFFGLVRP